MHLELLVEEQSAEVALRLLVPKIVGKSASFEVRAFQGKQNLRRKLGERLRGYRHWLPDNACIVVLVDLDVHDCRELKDELEQTALDAGLRTVSTAKKGQRFQVVNRLAIEELEAWFFGDVAALNAAYPRVPPSLGQRRRYRDPDAIPGGTWEALERVLQNAGYYSGGLPKVEAARKISAFMEPQRNRSKSFQVFRDTLLRICSS